MTNCLPIAVFNPNRKKSATILITHKILAADAAFHTKENTIAQASNLPRRVLEVTAIASELSPHPIATDVSPIALVGIRNSVSPFCTSYRLALTIHSAITPQWLLYNSVFMVRISCFVRCPLSGLLTVNSTGYIQYMSIFLL
jgi:hypothetical protein